MNKYEREVKQTLLNISDRGSEYDLFRKKTTNLETLGIRLPDIRTILKNGFSFFEKEEKEVLQIWNSIWHSSKIHEVLYLPLMYYEGRKKENGKTEWDVMKKWVDGIENWEHADLLSKIYSFLLEKDHALVYPTLVKWNQSKNPWTRRISIVSLIYYASKKRSAPQAEEVLPLIENLLHDNDPYIQKGVGWTLRECGNLYPNETWKFLNKHILDLSAISFSYATEKITHTQKEKLKNMRKKKPSK